MLKLLTETNLACKHIIRENLWINDDSAKTVRQCCHAFSTGTAEHHDRTKGMFRSNQGLMCDLVVHGLAPNPALILVQVQTG